MPLTFSTALLDDIEAKRRMQGRLTASSMQASRMGVDALAQADRLARGDREEARQAGLDQQKAAELKLSTARDDRAEKRDVDKMAFDQALRKAEEERASAAAGRKAAADDVGQARLVLRPMVESGRREGLLPEEIADRVREHPALAALPGDEEVEAAYADVVAEEEKRRLETDKTEADIRAKDAATKKAGRAGTTDPEAAKRRRLQDEKLQLDVDSKRRDASGEPDPAKAKAQVLEVETFARNIEDNITALENQIKETGTFELTGPASFDTERRITSLATDMAKLADPGSVAREGEVSLAKKGLFPTGVGGLLVNNETALEVLAHLRSEIAQRRANAYSIRGLTPPERTAPPPAAPVPAPTGMTPEKRARLEALRAKRGAP